MEGLQETIKALSPIEKKIIPFLNSASVGELVEKSKSDKTEVLRALDFLANKGIVNLVYSASKKVVLGTNGEVYLKNGLPERRLLTALSKQNSINLSDASKIGLDDNELKAAIGALKRRAMARLESGKIILEAKEEEVCKKMLEEQLIESLPINFDDLSPEKRYAIDQLKNRKEIIRIDESKDVSFKVTDLGKRLQSQDLSKANYIEQITPQIIKDGSWEKRNFRKYNIISPVPRIFGGRKQPYLSFLEDVREKLVRLGFEEMSGSLVENEFWNFDALFQPQYHVARASASTYYVKNKLKDEKIEKNIIEGVKKQHESSWKYKWDIKNALKLILRPQGTVLSARQLPKAKIPGKYFAIARCYRPDVVDAKHLSEFNQVEGIILDKNLTLKNLFYMLGLFAKEIGGIKDIKFVPHYFPFTEPSVEIHGKHPKLGWIEIGGAGILRREVVKPLIGKDVTVLAWGLGIDRLAMYKLGIDDIRHLFSYNIDFLRGIKNDKKESVN
ncbi:MAG: phenylalanine--tRNA ligase subunit alpha [archaeon]